MELRIQSCTDHGILAIATRDLVLGVKLVLIQEPCVLVVEIFDDTGLLSPIRSSVPLAFWAWHHFCISVMDGHIRLWLNETEEDVSIDHPLVTMRTSMMNAYLKGFSMGNQGCSERNELVH